MSRNLYMCIYQYICVYYVSVWGCGCRWVCLPSGLGSWLDAVCVCRR